MSSSEEAAAILVLAERQLGLFTGQQALACGVARRTLGRRVESGLWRRLLPDVYALAGIPVTWRQWVLASLLWGGEEACVSHRAAARLLGLDGVDQAPAEISLRWRRRSPHPDVVVRSTDSLLGQDVATLAPFRLTGATRTLIDLGWLVDESVLERALDDALRRRLTTIPRLRFRINQLRGHGRRGVAAIARLVEERDPRLPIPESLLESRVIRLLRAAGLPAPVRQHAVSADGRVIARLDLAYPEVLLAIECDGYRYHSGKVAWESDLRRRNLLTALGWRVLHFTWDDVERKPADVAGRVGVALALPFALSASRKPGRYLPKRTCAGPPRLPQ